jgi:hypothetical protein
MRHVVLALLLAACGDHSDDLCARTVNHVFSMTMDGPKGSAPGKDEQDIIDKIQSATRTQCRVEGLSQAQADCILGAQPPDWDDRVRTCPAFAAKPPSWVILRPTRDQRREMRDKKPIPNGPRETKLHFKQLVAVPEGMCGLTDAGEAQCWGEPRRAKFPAGPFVQLAATNDMACGRTAAGIVRCSLGDFGQADRTPTTPFSDFAIDEMRGCGIKISDKQVECWTSFDEEPLATPLAQFKSIAVSHTGACGRTTDGKPLCFGEYPPELPPDKPGERLARSAAEGGAEVSDALASSDGGKSGGCTIDKAHHLTCTTRWRMGEPPAGTFETVAVGGGFACAVRVGGGTVCWGENDDGECNVPQ